MSASHRLLHAAALSCLLSVTVSCGPSTGYPGPGISPRQESVVSVTNNNWSDIKVYAVRGSSKYRLGSVTSFSTATLRLPSAVTSASDFRLRVEVIGSLESHTTEVLRIGQGDRMEWVINAYLPMSHWAIR